MKLKKMLRFLLLIMIMSFHNAQMIKGQEEKNINIKIEPSKYNRLTLDDLDQVKMEILHDMNQHIKNIEDEMIDNQRLSDKSINSWSKSGAPIFIPNNPIYQEYSIPSMKDIVLGDKVNEPVVGYVQDDAKGKVRFKQTNVDEQELEQKLNEANNLIKQLKKITEQHHTFKEKEIIKRTPKKIDTHIVEQTIQKNIPIKNLRSTLITMKENNTISNTNNGPIQIDLIN